MKAIIKRATSIFIVFALTFSLCTFSVAAQEATTGQSDVQPMEDILMQLPEEVRAQLPSKPLVGTGRGTITDWGIIYLNMYNDPQAVSEIWILGNKDGGGANTSASFVFPLDLYGVNAAINGEWHRIYLGNATVTGGSMYFSISVADKNNPYNIAILAY